MEPNETWRTIGNFPQYSVSSIGRVRRDKRGRGPSGDNKIIAPCLDRYGYLYVGLYNNGSHQKAQKVHRLVAEAFLHNPMALPQVNHLSGCKTDNRMGNLEWTDNKSNILHAKENGLLPSGDNHHSRISPERLARGQRNGAYTKPWRHPRGERNGMSKLTASDILKIREERAHGVRVADIAVHFKVSGVNIYDILKNKTWKHMV